MLGDQSLFTRADAIERLWGVHHAAGQPTAGAAIQPRILGTSGEWRLADGLLGGGGGLGQAVEPSAGGGPAVSSRRNAPFTV